MAQNVRLTEERLRSIINNMVKEETRKKLKHQLNEVDDDTASELLGFYSEFWDYIEAEIKTMKANIGNFSSSEYVEGYIDALEGLSNHMNEFELDN